MDNLVYLILLLALGNIFHRLPVFPENTPLVLLLVLGISGPVFQVGVFEAAMPSMVMAGVLAAAGNLRADVANAAIG